MASEDDDQPASSYRLSIGGASEDILTDIDDRVLSPPSGMRWRKVSKLLTSPGMCSLRFHWFEGGELVKARSLYCHITELAGMHSFENLNKTDVIFSLSEAEDMEAAIRAIVETFSWMDWWTFSMKSLALKSSSDARLVRRLSLTGARCPFLVV